MTTLESAAAGEMCPGCDSLKQNVEFKTYYHEGGDTIVCEDCFNEMEGSEEEEEEEDEEEEEEEGQDCRGCGCWLPDGKECVFPESCDAFCEPCFEERQEHEKEDEKEEEWCEEHEQVMWKNGLKCSGCLDEEE